MLTQDPPARPPRARGEDGFTLIELLVVVVIIGILIAIAIPTYMNYKKSAADKAAESDVRNAVTTLEICNSENGTYPTALATSGGVPTGCAGQRVNLSENTSIRYAPLTGGYKIVGRNSGGTEFWCYNSTSGGRVRALAGPPADADAALTACT